MLTIQVIKGENILLFKILAQSKNLKSTLERPEVVALLAKCPIPIVSINSPEVAAGGSFLYVQGTTVSADRDVIVFPSSNAELTQRFYEGLGKTFDILKGSPLDVEWAPRDSGVDLDPLVITERVLHLGGAESKKIALAYALNNVSGEPMFAGHGRVNHNAYPAGGARPSTDLLVFKEFNHAIVQCMDYMYERGDRAVFSERINIDVFPKAVLDSIKKVGALNKRYIPYVVNKTLTSEILSLGVCK